MFEVSFALGEDRLPSFAADGRFSSPASAGACKKDCPTLKVFRTSHLPVSLAGMLVCLVAGCGNNTAFTTPQLHDDGLVVILPGIEGESDFNRDIRRGLVAAGICRALPIRTWGSRIPGIGMIINQINVLGNRLEGAAIAKEIMLYQDEFPGRPVHIVGHSGGGGIAVFVAEALPEDRKIDGLILLSASICRGHDLTKALGRCKNGILNLYTDNDSLLSIGTLVVGNVCGHHDLGAGLTGFVLPQKSDSQEKKRAYSRLYQIHLRPAMVDGANVWHGTGTDRDVIYNYIAPWIYASTWPATTLRPIPDGS